MKVEELENVLYLVKCNLYWEDSEGFHDWRECEVTDIMGRYITLHNENDVHKTSRWDIKQLEQVCLKLNEKHFSELKTAIDDWQSKQ